MKRQFLTLMIAFIFGCTAQADPCLIQKIKPCPSAPTTCLFQYIHQRECLMQAVAAVKYQHHQPIYDANQENTVLLNTQKNAEKYHLNPIQLQIFSQIQMDLSKQIESYWITRWESQHLSPPKPSMKLIDLRKTIAQLDQLTLSALIKSLPTLQNPKNYDTLSDQLTQSLNLPGAPPTYRLMLLTTLTQIK